MFKALLGVGNLVNLWYLYYTLTDLNNVHSQVSVAFTHELFASLIYNIGWMITHIIIGIWLSLLILSGDTVIVVDEAQKQS